MTTLRRLRTVTALIVALALQGCETNAGTGDLGPDIAPDAAGDTPVDTPPPADVAPDPGAPDLLPPADVTDTSDTSDTSDAADTPDIPHPTGCCEAEGDCPTGSVCLGLEFGAPGTCWPKPSDGGCFFDTDCGDGEKCLGEHQTNCVMSSLPWEGTCVKGPDDCCESDLDCTALGDYVCAATNGLQSPGLCMPRPADGLCWTDLQCGVDEHCKDAKACGCLVDCDGWIEAGHCEPNAPTDCCHTNEECGPNAYCVAGHLGAGGVCHTELLPDGSCFTDADCDGEELVCKGAQLCSCDMNCVSWAGTCLSSWSDCCFNDAQCTGGAICVGEGPAGYPGVCKLPAPQGTCWDDEECAFGYACEGEAICPCDADCDAPDAPGTCQPLAGCCQTNEDCHYPVGQEYVCAGYDATSGLGICLPAITYEGPCWEDVNCPVGQVCSGATFCPCGTLCGQIQAPGTCVDAPPDDCCTSNDDCLAGYVCVDLYPTADTNMPGACKPALVVDGMCWTDTNCAPDELCLGATPCPCNWAYEGDGCDIPGTCTKKAQYGCCSTDADCGADSFCLALTKTCVATLNPGHCYTDADCGEAGACVGPSFCPCGMLCTVGTMPGACQELPLGCCNADADCGEGFVCRADGGPWGLPGSCVPDPSGPACLGDVACCWNDGDCPGSSTCEGGYVCGCIELCPTCGDCMPDQMGTCK